jgi:excisionase family DNA binding protein
VEDGSGESELVDEGGENGDGKRRQRPSRDELVQRLVDPTLTLEQTATILGVCPTTVRRYTNKGLLPHFRTQGNQRRFRFSDVRDFQERQKGSPELQADMKKNGR